MSLPMDFAAAYAFIRQDHIEGGFVDHPMDPGKATKWGVTQATYDTYRDDEDLPARSVAKLTEEEARTIYERQYWRLCGAPALVTRQKGRLALCCFDWAVQAGVTRARTYLQLAVAVTPDGQWGPRTLGAIDRADDAAAAGRYLAWRADHYRARVGQAPARARLVASGLAAGVIPSTDPRAVVFLKGWLARLRHVARACQVPIGPTYARGTHDLTL